MPALPVPSAVEGSEVEGGCHAPPPARGCLAAPGARKAATKPLEPLLLDTHAFVWVASDHRRLTKAAKGAIQDHPGLSRAAAWLRPGLMEIASSGPHEPGNGPGSDEGHTLTFRRPLRGLQNMEPSCDPGLAALTLGFIPPSLRDWGLSPQTCPSEPSPEAEYPAIDVLARAPPCP